MRIYEGSPRQDFEEVFRSIGAFLDQHGMRDVLLVEAPDGFIVQGVVVSGASTGNWSESMGSQLKETLQGRTWVKLINSWPLDIAGHSGNRANERYENGVPRLQGCILALITSQE